MKGSSNALLRKLPAISKLLATSGVKKLVDDYGEGIVKLELKSLVERLRDSIKADELSEVPSEELLIKEICKRVSRICSPEARSAINATGVLLHTGLGRAPLADTVLRAYERFSGFSVLQVDIDTGERSVRESRIESMLRELTGCEAATVVNNNAAATHIILNTVARGKEVLISRGQLVEIGGSFRLPDVMTQAGVRLIEVGTTNQTHLFDYERAINEQTGAILHVDPSNFEIQGFSGTPSLEELCELGTRRGLPVIADLGSGALIDLSRYGLRRTTTIGDSVCAGAEVSCSSGDKLIGGPQAGVICGKRELIERIRSNPYARMFRVCKLTLAGLEETLLHYVNGDYEQHLSLYRMLAQPLSEVEARALSFQQKLSALGQVELLEEKAFVGGGALPGQSVPSRAVAFRSFSGPGSSGVNAEKLAKALRLQIPPIFCRVSEESLVFDFRSLMPGEEETLFAGVASALSRS